MVYLRAGPAGAGPLDSLFWLPTATLDRNTKLEKSPNQPLRVPFVLSFWILVYVPEASRASVPLLHSKNGNGDAPVGRSNQSINKNSIPPPVDGAQHVLSISLLLELAAFLLLRSL